MKATYIVLLLVSINLSIQAQEYFTIKGNIKGIEDGAVITLSRTEGRLGKVIASDTVKNEKFKFKMPVESKSPECLDLSGRGKGFPNTWLDVWTAAGAQIHISGEDKLLRTWKVESNIKEQQEYNAYENATRELQREELKLLTREREKAELLRSTDNKEIKKKLRKEINFYSAKRDSVKTLITQKEIELMKQTSSEGIVWMNKLERLSLGCRYKKDYPFRKEAIELYNRLTQQQKESTLGKVITTNIFPPQIVKEGDMLADADLYDLQGKLHQLSEFKGKMMLLDFWSSACGPCIMSIPELKEVSDIYKDRLHLISISEDPKETWKKASEKHNISWINLNDLQFDNGILQKYDVRGIPSYVIISPEGKIMQKWGGYSKGSLKSKLKKWLEMQQHYTTVEQTDKGIIVTAPIEELSNTSNLLIKKVELTDTATIVHFKAFQTPKQWIRIKTESYLKTDNKQYDLISAEGITPGKEFYVPETGEAEFKLNFSPLPMDTKSFDFMEGTSRSDWQLYGISLLEEKKQ